MKRIMFAAMLACQVGYIPSDVPGVCVEHLSEATANKWVSDEKPPNDKMPSYQREGVNVVNAPNMADEDSKADAEKREAEAQGKQMAGIKPK